MKPSIRPHATWFEHICLWWFRKNNDDSMHRLFRTHSRWKHSMAFPVKRMTSMSLSNVFSDTNLKHSPNREGNGNKIAESLRSWYRYATPFIQGAWWDLVKTMSLTLWDEGLCRASPSVHSYHACSSARMLILDQIWSDHIKHLPEVFQTVWTMQQIACIAFCSCKTRLFHFVGSKACLLVPGGQWSVNKMLQNTNLQ